MYPLVCDRTECCQVLEMYYNIPLKVFVLVCVCVCMCMYISLI